MNEMIQNLKNIFKLKNNNNNVVDIIKLNHLKIIILTNKQLIY